MVNEASSSEAAALLVESEAPAAPQTPDKAADGSLVIDLRTSRHASTAVAMFGSKSALADYLGVARTQPGRWIKGAENPSARAGRLLADADYVWGRATASMGEEAARIWLNSSSAFLHGATPLSWLKQHGPAEVIGALDATEAGSYA